MSNDQANTYQLCYEDQLLGNVTETHSDFPWTYGAFEAGFDRDSGSTVMNHLIGYYEYSLVFDDKLQNGPEQDWLAYCEEHEFQFEDLIEPSRWRLVEHDGASREIMIPIFEFDGGIRWKWEI